MAKSKTTIYYQKRDGNRFAPVQPGEYSEFEAQAPPGLYSFEIAKRHPSKTPKQCGMIFAHMIKETIIQANDLAIGVDDLLVYLIDGRIPKGVGLTTDFLHELMYVICPTTDNEGRRITLSKMDTKQAGDLFESFRTIMAPLGIVIDDPNPNWKAEQEKSKEKEA